MKQAMLKERMELLAIGEAMQWPRMGYGRTPEGGKLAIRPGKSGWEKFVQKPAKSGTPGLLTALRIARTLHGYGIKPYDPRPTLASILPIGLSAQIDKALTLEAGETASIGLVLLDAPIDDDPMVKPKRSSAAIRQQRWRERQKEKALSQS